MKKRNLFPVLIVLCFLFCTACAVQPDSLPADTPASPPQTDETPADTPPSDEQAGESISDKPEISQENLGFKVMQTLADFSFTTYDGKEISLYETLAEKELVVLNFWASWCGPCRSEFPHLEEAYGQFKDSVEIFALSTDEDDSNEVLAEYAAELGLTFPVGQDTAGIGDAFNVFSIPTTILVDRNGTICSIEAGARPSAEEFTSLFTPFLGDEYSGFTPPANMYCQVEPSDEADLAQALNAEGGNIVFKNPDNRYVWPFVVAEHNGRSVAVSSNAGLSETEAVITAEITAEAGQVLFIDFALSSERGCDAMAIRLNGDMVKGFALDYDYGGYAIPIEESGVYSLEISYIKDAYVDEGDDCLRIDTVALLSGAEAEAALAANPSFPHHDKTTVTALAEGAKQILLDDPNNILLTENEKDLCSFWLIPEGETDLLITIDETVDPESTLLTSNYDYSIALLLDCLDDGKYALPTKVDGTATTGYPFTMVDMQVVGTGNSLYLTLLFTSEEDVDLLLTQEGDNGEFVYTWYYADGSPRQTEYKPEKVSYTVCCVDEQGEPVAGVIVQVCDDSLCQVYTSDDEGLCTFSLPPYAYEIHILSVPEGYSYESDTVSALPDHGGSAEYVFKKIS